MLSTDVSLFGLAFVVLGERLEVLEGRRGRSSGSKAQTIAGAPVFKGEEREAGEQPRSSCGRCWLRTLGMKVSASSLPLARWSRARSQAQCWERVEGGWNAGFQQEVAQ